MTPSNPASGTNEAADTRTREDLLLALDDLTAKVQRLGEINDELARRLATERAIGGPRDLSVLDFIGTLRWIADNGGIPAEGSEREARLVELWERRLRLPATERAIGAGIDGLRLLRSDPTLQHECYHGGLDSEGLPSFHVVIDVAILDDLIAALASETPRPEGPTDATDA